MTLRTLIIDDEPIALEKLRSYVDKVSFLELTGACGSGFEAMELIAGGEVCVDLIITDINMPDLNGMDFVGALPNPPADILITAKAQYAVDSYRLNAVDYLLKPYGFVDFQRAVGKALERLTARRRLEPVATVPESLFVKIDHRYQRVALSDILFIKGYGEYLQIYTCGSDAPLVTLSSFSAVMERLTDDFLQVHRSFIVNMNRVDRVERNRLQIGQSHVVPVGESYRNSFRDYLSSHAVGVKIR